MRIKKDSLLFKAILYNDISILLTSFIMFFVLGYYIFNDVNNEIPHALETASKNLRLSYKMIISDRKKEFYKLILSKKVEDALKEIELLYKNNSSDKNLPLISELSAKLLSDITSNGYENEKKIKEFSLNNVLSIISKNGMILAEYSADPVEHYSIKNSLLIHKELESHNKEIEFIEYVPELKSMVLRTGRLIDDTKYLILSTKLDNNFIKYLSGHAGLNEGVKLFILNNFKYLNGNLDSLQGKKVISHDQFRKLKKNNCFSDKLKIKNTSYNISYCNLNFESRTNLVMGIALSRYEVFSLKVSYYIVGILTLFVLLMTASSIFGYKYYKLFTPLIQLSEISDKISQGNLDLKIKVKSTGEIKSLVKSFRKMLKTIKLNHKDLELQNEKLKESIIKINMVEKLLLNIHSEDNIDKIIYYILTAFTSEVGLNYGRAIYFEYDEEVDQLNGKLASTNIKLVDESNKLYKFTSGLKLQTESLDKIIKLISVPLEKNILAEAFFDEKIIFHNDRGFNYKLGNELLVSLGLNNFIIMPVYSSSKKYGCIVLDNSATGKIVNQEDIEMLNLLSMNITIHLENKELHDDKVESERKEMIGRLSKKILLDIQEPLNEVRTIIEGHSNSKEDIHRLEIEELKYKIGQVVSNSSLLFDYSDIKNYQLSKIDIKDVLDKSLENLDIYIKSSMVNISKLYNHKSCVYGNNFQLEKVFSNLIKNAVEAVVETGGRVNIITSSQEHRVIIKIIDNGIGISEEDKKNIFEPFVSINKTSSGLGLSVAKKIIEEHSGEIRIKSEKNRGTEIKVILNIYKEA